MTDSSSDDRPDHDDDDATGDLDDAPETSIGRETAEADAEDPTIGGSSDGDT